MVNLVENDHDGEDDGKDDGEEENTKHPVIHEYKGIWLCFSCYWLCLHTGMAWKNSSQLKRFSSDGFSCQCRYAPTGKHDKDLCELAVRHVVLQSSVLPNISIMNILSTW